MTANIFNAYEMLTTATVTAVIVGAAVKAWDILKQRDGRAELAAANGAWSNALAVAAENDRQRWAPAYSENTGALPAVADDEHVTGEVLAVEAAPSLPALSDQSHEDEQAPAEDDDHAGAWWLPLMTVPLLLARLVGWLIGVAEVGYERLADAVGEMRRARQSRNRLDGDETPLTDDDFETDAEAFAVEVEQMREAERGTEAAIAEEIAELTGEPVEVVIARRQGHRYLPTGAYPLVRVTGAEPGRHRAVEVDAEYEWDKAEQAAVAMTEAGA